MLVGLSIRDFVLIDRLDVAFRSGLCVLTGETGAGKSILLDALGQALGARADAALVRAGAARAIVIAEFRTKPDHPCRGLLDEHGVEAEDGLVLRRTLSEDGGSRAFINDQPVSVGLLRRIGDTLVEIQGQFESRGLLNPASHREALDVYGGLGREVASVRKAFRAWREAGAARARFAEELETARADEAFLRGAAAELDAIDPQPGEAAELARTREMLMHGEQLIEALNAAYGLSAGSDGAEDKLHTARRHLDRVAKRAGGRLDPVLAALDRALSELADANAELQSLGSAVDLDPRTLESVEERLFALRDLARKHRVDVDALAELRRELGERLAAVENRDAELARLAAREGEARAAYETAATILRAARLQAGRALDVAVSDELPPLRLRKAIFHTRVEPLEPEAWGSNGMDRVSFEVATNPGAAPGPIARIASGGELSRFMLALKVVLSREGTAPTIVFDEVDSGIGGATAAAVGQRLARLSSELQVLVVTHSPQVAARADHHWRAEKMEQSGTVTTGVVELTGGAEREEVARMLSGESITDEARAAAERLIAGGSR